MWLVSLHTLDGEVINDASEAIAVAFLCTVDESYRTGRMKTLHTSS